VLIVAGLSLKNLKPRVWDKTSPYYLPGVEAVMVSYTDFHKVTVQRQAAMTVGLHEYLGVSKNIKIYLDNGAFYFLTHDGETPRESYEEFVDKAKPDWWPIPQDFIPSPQMTLEQQQLCRKRTMDMNEAYQDDGYVPIIHISRVIEEYIAAVESSDALKAKSSIGLGGIVPNLLRAPKAMPYQQVFDNLTRVRQVFAGKELHLFGVGGTATLHLAALMDIDSVDSSGWRNRAARGIVQLPGSGDRMVASLGSWRGRAPDKDEWDVLTACVCPACQHYGLDGLKGSGIGGFCSRATHNLWVLLNEANEIQTRLEAGTYGSWYVDHLDNSIYRSLVQQAFALREHRMNNTELDRETATTLLIRNEAAHGGSAALLLDEPPIREAFLHLGRVGADDDALGQAQT